MKEKELLSKDLPLLAQQSPGYLSLSLSPEVTFIIDQALLEMQKLVSGNHVNLYYYDESGILQSYKQPDDVPGLQSLAKHSIEQKESFVFNPTETNPSLPDEITKGLESESLCVSLHQQGGTIGSICIQGSRYFDSFYPADLQLIESFAASFSILLKNGWRDSRGNVSLNFKTSLLALLENAHLQQKIKDSRHRLNTVLEVSNLINSSKQLDKMIQSILYSCRKVMRAQSASMFMVDEETSELYFDIVSNKAEEKLKGFRVPPGQGIVGLCAESKESIVVNDAENDPRIFRAADETSDYITRNLIAAPLLVNERCIGVIEVLNTIDRSAFTENDIDLFESFADSVALAVQRRILLDELQHSNLELERKLNETRTLHAVTAAMMDVLSINDMFSSVLEIIQKNLGITMLSVMLMDEKTNRLKLESACGNYDPELFTGSIAIQGLAGKILENNEPIFIKDINEDETLSRYASQDRYHTGTCILVPLNITTDGDPVGLLCASEPEAGQFREEDFTLLRTIGVQLSRGYQNFLLNQEMLAKKAIEKELEITSRIQRNILPGKMPVHRHVHLEAASEMARTTGGDFFDFFVHSPDGPVTCLVADVSGKSLPAALFMAVSSSILRTIIRMETEPTVILEKANDLLYEESDSGMFVTVFLARYEPDTGQLIYASAGHNEMILLHPDESYELLSGKGHPLGVLSSYLQKYRGGQIRIRPNDLLILYTDGLIEAANKQGDEFGMERFIEHLITNKNVDPGTMIHTTLRAVENFSDVDLQTDDNTMLVARFPGVLEGAREYSFDLPANRDSVPKLREMIREACLKHGLYGNELDDILLVSDEAATNIIMHAYEGIQTNLELRFVCDLQIETNNYIRLNFSDHGKPFPLDEVQSPDLKENLAGKRKGGFGVYLIKSLMNSIEYDRVDGVNYLRTERKLKSSSGKKHESTS